MKIDRELLLDNIPSVSLETLFAESANPDFTAKKYGHKIVATITTHVEDAHGHMKKVVMTATQKSREGNIKYKVKDEKKLKKGLTQEEKTTADVFKEIAKVVLRSIVENYNVLKAVR